MKKKAMHVIVVMGGKTKDRGTESEQCGGKGRGSELFITMPSCFLRSHNIEITCALLRIFVYRARSPLLQLRVYDHTPVPDLESLTIRLQNAQGVRSCGW
jgi:hypothetical protein